MFILKENPEINANKHFITIFVLSAAGDFFYKWLNQHQNTKYHKTEITGQLSD